MLTLDYLKWFLRNAGTKQYVHHVTSTLYLYLFTRAAESGLDYIPSTTLEAIANDTGINLSTVGRSLKQLAEMQVIKKLPNGQIYFLPPDIRWLQKRDMPMAHARSNNATQIASALIPRAQDRAALGKPTLQGRVTPPETQAEPAEKSPNERTNPFHSPETMAKWNAALERMNNQQFVDAAKRAASVFRQ